MTRTSAALALIVVLGVPIAHTGGVEPEQFPRGLMASARILTCTIETRPIAFGEYDTEQRRDLDAKGEVIYTCAEVGAPSDEAQNIRIEMSPGAAVTFSPRRMTAGTGVDFLEYNVYLDASHRTIWGNGTNGTDVYFDRRPSDRRPVTVKAYGRIFARQDARAGQYADSLHVVILF